MPPFTKDDPTTPLRVHHAKQQFMVSPEQLCQLVDARDVISSEGLCRALKVDPTVGLCPDESFAACYGISQQGRQGQEEEQFRDRKLIFGRNEIPEAPAKTIWMLLWKAYNDQTLIMLTVASVVSLAVGIWEDYSANHPKDEPRIGWVDGVAIIIAVGVVVITNAINDYEKEKQFRKLNAKKEDRPVKALRGGVAQQIPVREVVVGDILFLEPGDMITVDAVYLEGYNLRCDESATTGESQAIKKTARDDCVVLSGSKVVQGVAKVLVVAVGERSLYGRAMALMRSSQEESTPLQLKLNVLADQIAKFGFAAAGLMLGILLLKLAVICVLEDQWPSTAELLSELVSIVIQAITVIVVAVPEGLPMAVTLALAFATTEMLKDNNLVRHLSACETMGNATAVCSDKTGTLTENIMTVVKGNLVGQSLDNTTTTTTTTTTDWRRQIHPAALDLIAETIAVNTTAFRQENTSKYVGSTTECALLEFAQKLGYAYQHVRANTKVVSVYPFSPETKSMTTVIQARDGNARSPEQTEYRVHTKGAPEVLLRHCTRTMDSKGRLKPLDHNERLKQERLVHEYAKTSLRTLVLAYRDVDHAALQDFHPDDAPLSDLVLLGVVGIQDRLRPGVTESVQAFRRAGVFVRMITGDSLETAKAIAKECGILTGGGIAMTGPEFRALGIKEQCKIIPRLQVLARSSPIDKTIVISRLQELNEVVAMTGDGTNDGPALKLANVGFAMGITGTEVAKEASDIILMDDNFNSILQALKWGRAVNDGVRKFLTFQLTVNMAAVAVSLVSAVVSETSESILSAVQLLWVNMIMDTFAALALATEPLTEELVRRKPQRKDSSLINWRMSRMIFGQSLFQIAVNLLLMFHGPVVFGVSDPRVLRTMVFNVFVFMQVFNELNCRRIDDDLNILRGITHDYLFLIIQAFVVIGQFLIVQYGGLAFKTVPLNSHQWLCTVAIGALSIPTGMLIRLLPPHIPYIWSQNTKDEFTHTVTYSRLLWESAVHRVLQGLKSFDNNDKEDSSTLEHKPIQSKPPL